MDPNATKPLDISNNNNQQQLRRGSSLDASMAAGRRDSMDSGAFMQEAAGSRASSFDGGSSTGTRPSLLGEGGKGAWKEARAKKWGLTQPDSATAFWSA